MKLGPEPAFGQLGLGLKELEETDIPGAGAPEHAHVFQNNTRYPIKL